MVAPNSKCTTKEGNDDGNKDRNELGAGTKGGNNLASTSRGAVEQIPANSKPTDLNPSNALGRNIRIAPQSNTPSVEQRKAENSKKAEVLRAKLMAARQNTLEKELPEQDAHSDLSQSLSKTQNPDMHGQELEEGSTMPFNGLFDLESLLVQSKAAMETKMEVDVKSQSEQKAGVCDEGLSRAIAGITDERKSTPASSNTAEQNVSVTGDPQSTTQLGDAYYADLQLWLEITGYHDIAHRDARLCIYKERKMLEEEAARITARLEKLKETEKAESASLRAYTPRMPAADMPPPPPALPETFQSPIDKQHKSTKQTATSLPLSNGVKRTHSPEARLTEKCVRHTEGPTKPSGKGSQGRDEAFQADRTSSSTPLSTDLGRKVSFPQVRGRSNDYSSRSIPSREMSHGSVERRQTYNARDNTGSWHSNGGTRSARTENLARAPGDVDRDRFKPNGFGNSYRPSRSPQYRSGSSWGFYPEGW